MNDQVTQPKRRESDMYGPALDFLNTQPGTLAWVHWNNAIYDPRIKCFRRKAHHVNGIADILGIKCKVSGRMKWSQAFAFEFKLDGEKPSEDQIRWLEKFSDNGGVAYIVTSVQDVMDVWREI